MPHFDRILDHVESPKWRRRLYSVKRVLQRLRPFGGMSEGNYIEVFKEQHVILAQMLSAIEQAQKRVWLETYIYEGDAVGTKIRDALIDARTRGCEVILLYDHFGSSRLPRGFMTPLLKAGAEVVNFNPIWAWRRKGPLLFRNHRKVLIIDEDLSFCGSMNISLNPGMSFRDTVMKIKGPATQELGRLFLEALQETTGEEKSDSYVPAQYPGGVFAQVLASNQRRKIVSIQRSMELSLNRATTYCYFTTPYFLPHAGLRKAMIEAAERGVDVRVLTAGLSDVPLMRLAAQYVYSLFLRAGIRIYELDGQTLHAKTAVIDGIYAWVGSYNLDHWSARRNLEVNVGVIDPYLADELEAHFDADLESSREISWAVWRKRSWFRRIVNFMAYQVMRL
ncbi:MAG: phospholipase D-like domain-containing protein [Myxococcota bacterium]